MDTYRFWDNQFSKSQANSYYKVDKADLNDPALQRALSFLGSVEGKTGIDLGCGNGAASLFFALHGANVISIDFSQAAIENLAEYCSDHGIKNITPVQMVAQDISLLGKVDFIYGSMILHHIEPFEGFARILAAVIKPGGKGFFRENNAQSSLMMWFRKNIVGRFGIVKFSDREETPFTRREVDLLRKHFVVEIEYPELLYFRMISYYLLKNRLFNLTKALDANLYRFPSFRKNSYHQYLLLSNRCT